MSSISSILLHGGHAEAVTGLEYLARVLVTLVAFGSLAALVDWIRRRVTVRLR